MFHLMYQFVDEMVRSTGSINRLRCHTGSFDRLGPAESVDCVLVGSRYLAPTQLSVYFESFLSNRTAVLKPDYFSHWACTQGRNFFKIIGVALSYLELHLFHIAP